MGSSEVETLKVQLREAQSANDDLIEQLKAAQTSWKKCIEDAEQKAAHARQELQRFKAEKVGKKFPAHPAVVRRLQRKLRRNVAREMSDAQQGFVIQKVTEKHGKTEVRRVSVCPQTCMLKWCHAQDSLAQNISQKVGAGAPKSLDLQTVERLEYGIGARAAKLIPEASPWHCFSVSTAERSYDFIGSNEKSTRCFVLSISRLCEDNAEGTFRSRHDFEVSKGWAKLKYGNKRRGTTMAKDFLQALRKVGATLPKSKPVPVNAKLPEVSDLSKPMDLFDFCNEEAKMEDPPQRTTSAGSELLSNPGASPKSNGSFKPALGRLASATDEGARGFMSWMTGSGGGAVWPKAGETWVFTGAVDQVDLYRAADATEWVNEMTCRSQSERRMVTIISALPQQNMVEIRGTDKLKFVKGWTRMVDADGQWLLEKAPLK